MCSAVKEIFEDAKRHKEDTNVNQTEIEVVDRFTGKMVKKMWKDIEVGSIVLLRQDGYFPADLVLLSTNEHSGKSRVRVLYIESFHICFLSLAGRYLLHRNSEPRWGDKLEGSSGSPRH